METPRFGPIGWLAMATGARRGELCALRWRHVDLAQDVLVIQAGIAQANGEMWETDTKLHQRRHRPHPPSGTFWEGVDLDLTGATLVHWTLDGCRVHRPNRRRSSHAPRR